MYTPNLGVWITKDPIEADENSYRYVKNNPITGVDPTGCRVVFLEIEDKSTAAFQIRHAAQEDGLWRANFRRIDGLISDVDSLTDPEFDQLKDAGRVEWNKEVFGGSRSQFKALLQRERQSDYVKIAGRKGDLLPLRNYIAAQSRLYDDPGDMLVVEMHGTFLSEDGVNPVLDVQGRMQFTGHVNLFGEAYGEADTVAYLSGGEDQTGNASVPEPGGLPAPRGDQSPAQGVLFLNCGRQGFQVGTADWNVNTKGSAVIRDSMQRLICAQSRLIYFSEVRPNWQDKVSPPPTTRGG